MRNSQDRTPATADVIVIGGGHAGLVAAITAREAKADVVLLDSAASHARGGNSRHTRNLRVAHNAPVATLPGSYTADEFRADLMRVTQGETNPELLDLTIERSEALLRWLLEQGVRFQPSLRGTLSLERTNAFFLGGGCALVNTLYRRAATLGVSICLETECTGLDVCADGSIVVEVANPTGQSTLSARAAVLASGGFQANRDWMREVWGEAADNFIIRGTNHATGRVLRRLMDLGYTSVGAADQCHAIAVDSRAPTYDGGIVSRTDAVPLSIVVNRLGERFYDEGEDLWPRRYAIWGRLIARQPGQRAYAIYDQRAANDFVPSAYPPIKADDPASLARQIDVPQDTLVRTLEAYNGAVIEGTFDPQTLDSCRTRGLAIDKTHWARPIDQPPFYAVPLAPGITFTYLGLEVDREARVIHTDGTSANLFAAGEIMAGNVLGRGYCAGTGMTIGGVFGRIAGAQAARW